MSATGLAAATCIATWRPSERSASRFPRLEPDDDADPPETLDDLVVHVLADRALGDAQALDARKVMFSPMVAMALAIASETVAPLM